MLLCMTNLLGLLLSTILVLLIELIESALEHYVDILRYINMYALLLYVLKSNSSSIILINISGGFPFPLHIILVNLIHRSSKF